MDYIIVFITTASLKEAKGIASYLVDKKLVACVNIINNIRSIYLWKGKVEDSKECLLIAKSKRRLFVRLKKEVKKIHSYDVPEIIATKITAGNKSYLKWIDESVKVT